MYRRCFLPAVLALLMQHAPPARADFNDGVVAYLSGNYREAFVIMQALAETQEHELAMYYLAIMLQEGRGVEPDARAAARWLRTAAEKGVPQAQNRLARLYRRGEGVPRDYEQAYAWLRTALLGGHEPSRGELAEVAQSLSAEEREAADVLARDYVRRYRPDREERPESSDPDAPAPRAP